MMLGILHEQFSSGVEMGVLAHAGENVEHFAAGRRGVLHAVGRQDRQSIFRGKIDK